MNLATFIITQDIFAYLFRIYVIGNRLNAIEICFFVLFLEIFNYNYVAIEKHYYYFLCCANGKFFLRFFKIFLVFPINYTLKKKSENSTKYLI